MQSLRLFTEIPLAKADYVIFVIEDHLYIDARYLKHAQDQIPKRKRIVIDADGRFDSYVNLAEDRNHRNQETEMQWTRRVEELSEKIFQPSIQPRNNVQQFLYFGYEEPYRSSSKKKFDISYVGNNWYRWAQIVDLTKILHHIRSRLEGVALTGKWWNGKPLVGRESDNFSDTAFLEKYGIEVFPSVPFGTVIQAMSLGRVNPILVRPVLDHMRLLTPRMFETIAADTVPVFLPSRFKTAEELYGADASMFRLCSKEPSKKIVDMRDDPEKYREPLEHIRLNLWSKHRYEIRFKELISILNE